MALTDLDRLSDPPGRMARLPSGAAYYEGADIVAHLNRCLTPAGWSWATGEHGYDELADQVWVVGTLTTRIVVEALDGSEAMLETRHTERGWKAVSRSTKDQSFVDLGNDYKSADTDALKRAARLIGVGLDAWMKPASRQAGPRRSPPAGEPAGSRTNGSPSPEPLTVDLSPSRTAEPLPASQGLSASARDELRARYVDLLARARARDFRASWTRQDLADLNDIQLDKYVGLLTNYLARQGAA